MTKEQAIKTMNEWNKCEELVIRENTDYDKTIYIQRKEAIETVLNMLKEKNREINSKNGTINALQCALKERTEERDRKDNIITKQNKIIDLMSEEINETDRGYTDYCEMKIECDRNCKDCIKRYFEREARDEQ